MDYFGEDASKYAERSPLAGLVKTTIPLMAVHASLDTARFRQQAQQLNQELCKAGRCPRFVALAKHSHASEIYAFNTRDKALSDQVLAFVNNGK
jgi:triacylglycerol lipase